MKTKLIATLASLLVLSGCHTYRTTDLSNFKYEKLPLKSKATKEGKACVTYSFPASLFYSNADLTIETAKKNANITEVVSVEKESSSSIGYRKDCVIVKGN